MMITALLVMFMVSALFIQIIQILQFLRTDTKVEGKGVLAVVLPGGVLPRNILRGGERLALSRRVTTG